MAAAMGRTPDIIASEVRVRFRSLGTFDDINRQHIPDCRPTSRISVLIFTGGYASLLGFRVVAASKSVNFASRWVT
jgi:hypothetical protein